MEPRIDATQQSYDRIAGEYARRISDELTYKPLDRALLDCFVEQVGGRGLVADIGCGPGHVAGYLHDHGLDTIGIDLSPGMINEARRLNPGMTFEQGDMLALNAGDGEWAGLTAFYSIIHIPPESLSQVCAEFYRVLAPGGLMLVAFHLGNTHLHVDDLWGYPVDLHSEHYDRAVVEGALEGAGFAITASIERLPDPAVEYASRRGYLFARKPSG